MTDHNKCKGCLGECPENCKRCIYSNCKKDVDFALVDFNWERYLNSIGTKTESQRAVEFYNWYRKYFNLDNIEF